MRRVTALATAAATLATLGLTSLGLGPGGSVAPSAYAASAHVMILFLSTWGSVAAGAPLA